MKTELFGVRYKKSNIESCTTADINSILEWTKNPQGFITIQGPVGSGKTYCASAIYEIIRERFKNVFKKTEMQLFFHCWKPSEKNESDCDFVNLPLESIKDYDLIILEDIGHFHERDFCREQIANLISEIDENEKACILTTTLETVEFGDAYGEKALSIISNSKNKQVLLETQNLREKGL